MKAGIKTTEFWTTIISQGLAILTLVGFLSSQDAQLLETALGQCVAAAFLFAVNAYVVVQYIKGRVTLKQGEGKNGKRAAALLLALGMFLFAGPVQAAPLLPWRSQIDQRLQEHHRLIVQLIGQQQRPAPPAPLIVPGPIYQLPIPGEPKQVLPIPGDPKQQLPIGGEPKQVLPPQGDPKQILPGPGDPKQIMPPATQHGPQAYTLRLHALGRPVE